jgi:amidohydrolase
MNFEQVVAWRRHIHQHPELSRQEYETSQYIFDELSKYPGIRLTRPTETSVVAEIGPEDKEVVLLRADIDALAMDEEINTDYKSVNPGVAHTCGHDVHAAMMMGVAAELSFRRGELDGAVRIVFATVGK